MKRLQYYSTTSQHAFFIFGVQTHARLAAAYGEDDLGSSVEELEEYTRELDPTMRDSRTKLQTKNVDLQVGVLAENIRLLSIRAASS